MKNFLALTLMSLGLPMITMGDEVRRTQQGNNNAYCLDEETNWFDWSLVERHADVHRFVSLICARRTSRDSTHNQRRVGIVEMLQRSNHAWHGVRLNQPDWSDSSHCIALTAELPREGINIHFILNSYHEPLEFELPPTIDGGPWRRWIDTGLDSPDDIVPWRDAVRTTAATYSAAPRSVVLLFSGGE